MSPEEKARYFADLQKGKTHCPYCGAEGDELFPAEEGLEELDESGEHARCLSHLIYCTVEDRNFTHIYAPTREPKQRARLKCPECGEAGDLEDVPPQSFFDIRPAFVARIRCASCGALVGEEKYTVVDVRDGQ